MDFFWQNGFSEVLFGIILGLVQGVTEFLPISSTAHLRLISEVLVGRDIGLKTSNVIQFGTLLAILQYFRQDLKVFWLRISAILQGFFAADDRDRQNFFQTFQNWSKVNVENEKLLDNSINQNNPEHSEIEEKNRKTDITLSQLLVGTLPIIIMALFLRNFAESHRSVLDIGIFVIIGGVLLALGEFFHLQTKKLPHTKNLNFGEVILVGIFQSLAIFPGMSRSGSILAGSLFLGRDRAESVRFAFLLSIPAIFLSGIWDMVKMILDLFTGKMALLPSVNFASGLEVKLSLLTVVVSFVFSYFAGLLSLKWLLKFLSSNTNSRFIIYRLILGLCLIIWAVMARK
jgi:undecaprenyl-diphosphatase